MKFGALPNFKWMTDKAREINALPISAPPIIRTIYINTVEHLRLVRYCLWHTVQHNPDSRIILAIDQASTDFEDWAQTLSPKVETFRMSGKRPHGGRMNLLTGEALKRIENSEPLVITSEQDAILDSSIIPVLWALLERYKPESASMQAMSCLFDGRCCYPSASHNRRFRRGREYDGFAYEMQFTTFWTVAWRTEALREVNWSKTRPHIGADQNACNQMAETGWRFYSTPHCRGIHQSHSRILPDGRGFILSGENIQGEKEKRVLDRRTIDKMKIYKPRAQLIKELQSGATDERRAEIRNEFAKLENRRLGLVQ